MNTVNCRTSYLMEVKKLLPELPVCVEIGVHRGEFSKQIYDILKPDLLYLVDPFETGGKRYGEDMGFMHVAYSTDEDFKRLLQWEKETNQTVCTVLGYSHEVCPDFEDRYFDFIYIDGSHLYEDVKRDLNDWLPKLKDGGVIGGHDYIAQPSFGVIASVNEFCKEHGFEMILFNPNGGDFALKKII